MRKRDVHVATQPSKTGRAAGTGAAFGHGEIRTIDTSVEIAASRLAAQRRSSPQQRSAFADTVVGSAQATAREVIAEITGRKR